MSVKQPPKGSYSKALAMAKRAHAGQKRQSGDPYISHPTAVAELLRDVLKADDETLAAALLHDTLEDTKLTREEIGRAFGPTILKLVEGVTKVSKVEREADKHERNLMAIRNMFRVMGRDLRVIFIKLADRLHNMQSLDQLSEVKRQRIARETADIYCPLANLVGIRPWFDELSDRSFEILQPAHYNLIERKRQRAAPQKAALQRWASRLQAHFRRSDKNVSVKLQTLPAHVVFSETHGQGSRLNHAESFARLLVTCRNEADCYRMLGAMHAFVETLPRQISDFIARPKTNGYQALHTAVLTASGQPINVVIQSETMQAAATYGAALMYQQPASARSWHKGPPWLETLMALETTSASLQQFFSALQTELFGARSTVHVAKKRQLRTLELPASASVLDAAYAISEETGRRTRSATVNGEAANLKRIVQDGDTIAFISRQSGTNRSTADLYALHTTEGKRRLLETLGSLGPHYRKKRGHEFALEVLDMLIDPFFSTTWHQTLAKRLSRHPKLEVVGAGQLSPFQLIADVCKPADVFLLDPACFAVQTHLPMQPVRFTLQASLNQLRSGNIIGIQVRPDVVDIVGRTKDRKRLAKRAKPLLPLKIAERARLLYPFYFLLQWTFVPGANPLSVIANLQGRLDTPTEFLAFDGESATLRFHTDRLETFQLIYEYLSGHPDITHLHRLSP